MHFYSLDREATPPESGFFNYETTSRYAYARQFPDTVAFIGWYSPRFNDFVIRQNDAWDDGVQLGYLDTGVIFWAYSSPRANATKLRSLVSANQLENFQTGWDEEAEELLASKQWFELESLCYLPVNDFDGAKAIHRWNSEAGPWVANLLRFDGKIVERFELFGDSPAGIEEIARARQSQYNEKANPPQKAYSFSLTPGRLERPQSPAVKIVRKLF